MKTRRPWLLAIALAILIVPASAQGASIGGTVSAVGGGGPIEGIEVCASKSWLGTQCAATGIDGKYEIAGLGDGKYTVKFEGGEDYVDRWFDGGASQSLADPVTVAGSDVTGIDAELEPAGKIEGTVVDALSGTPVEGVQVCPYPGEGYGSNLPCGTTDEEGKYTIGGMPAGSYGVEFSAGYEPASRDYLVEYFDGATSRGQGTVLDVSAGATVTGIDAALEKGGQISGAVSGNGGQPLENVQVCAEPIGGPDRFGPCASTGADGAYTIHRVRSGSYKIHFSPFSWSGNYLGQYYDDQPSRKTATAVEVTAPATLSGIDATLHPGGQISGTITAADTDSPLNQAQACATKVAGNGLQFCAQTASDGTYTIRSLPTGNYELVFTGGYMGRQYVTERYDDQPLDGSGQQLAVTAGETLQGIDAALSRGASISGHVEDAVSGDPLLSISVCPLVDGQPIDEIEGCVLTDVEGDYEFPGLPPGTYTVRFKPGVPFGPAEPGDPRYATQFYDGATSAGSAQPLELEAGEDATGIDAQMSFGATVSGTITGSGGVPLPSGYACTVLEDKEEERCGWANKHGEYAIQGLGAGDYVLRFGANPEGTAGWLSEYWDDEATAELADPLSVTGTPGEIGGVDVELAAAGGISGRVTAAGSGEPIGNAFVCAIPDGETEASNCSETWLNGNYLIPMLSTGSYRVEFSVTHWEEEEEEEAFEEYETQFYPGAGQLEAGSLVDVTAGSTTGSIDAAMLKAPANPPGPNPGGSGDEGSSSEPPRTGAPLPPSKPKPLRCRKGFKAKKIHGKRRCVKKKHRPHHKKHR